MAISIGRRQSASAKPLEQTSAQPNAKATIRLACLDAFRGLTVVLMLLVNNIALDIWTPPQLLHAGWDQGVRLADLVFPWFLFCVGVAIPYSAASYRRQGKPLWRFLLRALSRCLVLVALGVAIDSAEAHAFTPGLGVLQLIGLAYFVGVLVYEAPAWVRGGVAVFLLAGYALALRLIPVPGYGTVFSEQMNLPKHVNETFLKPIYLAGLISVVPTAALIILASLVGDLLRLKTLPPIRLASALLAIGTALTLLGVAANSYIPYNKPVWTSSYILLSAGLAVLTLLLFYLMADVPRWTFWTAPLRVFGANAILAYVAPILIKVLILQNWPVFYSGKMSNAGDVWMHSMFDQFGRIPGGWYYTWSYILVWWLILTIFYWRKWFVRV